MPVDTLNMSDNEKNVYLHSLVFIANLEGLKDSSDKIKKQTFMENHIKALGISIENLKNIKVKGLDGIVTDVKSIVNIKVKKYILREMILLAISDHELGDDEISKIYQIGIAAGIKEERISQFFLWAAKGLEWEMEGNKLLEEEA